MEADRLNPLNLLLRGPDQPRPSFRWGTVTAVNPSTSRAAEEIAKSVSQQVNIAFIGDSETAGVTLSTSGYERSWPVVFSHLAGTVGGHAYRNNHNGAWNPDPRWVIHPDASYSAGGGFVPRHSIGLGETIVFNGTEQTTQVRVHYLNQGFLGAATGPFSVSIDGGTPTTVTPNNTSTIGTWTSGTLGLGPHSVTLTGTSGTYDATIVGISQLRPGQGIFINNAGISGAVTNDFNATHHMSAWYAAVTIAQPDVIFLSLGVNDAAAGLPVATYAAQYETIIDRALTVTDAVVIVNQPHAQGLSWGLWKDYRDAAKALADDRGLMVVDITDLWGSYTDAYARGWMADPTHPSGEGYARMARDIALATGTLSGLEITLDTETEPISKPSTLVDLEVGDRVFTVLDSRRATVLGKVPSNSSPGWLTYSPVLFSATGTDPTMGNSIVSGRYRVDGKTVHVAIDIVFGSSFSAGSGLYGITLPVMARTDIWQLLQVAAVMGGDRNGHAKIEGSTGIVRIHLLDSGALVALGGSGGSVIIPASGNRLVISGTYEAA